MDKRIWWPMAVAAACMAVSGLDVASAKVPAAEADQLGNTLTCMGSPKAGTKDGLIPAWTGKWESAPPYIHYTQEDANQGKRYPNAYPNDKPLFTITKANMAKYAEHLSQGEQALFNTYPDYQMVIYPSHRDFRYPKYFCTANKYNALHTVITDAQNGGFKDAIAGGVPFPIAKTGIEMLLDSTVTAAVPWMEIQPRVDSGDVLANGSVIWGATRNQTLDPANSLENRLKGAPLVGVYAYTTTQTLLPLRERGSVSVTADPVNYAQGQRITWSYDPGTRRVSQVPVFGFDQPLAGTNGTVTIDTARIFNGSPMRFKWKNLGERELYMLADNYNLQSAALGKDNYHDLVSTKHFPNPKDLHFELQRVYVLEGTLRPGYRHIYHKRIIYINADTHQAQMTDLFDSQGRLWRTGVASSFWAYNAHLFAAGPEFYMDLLDKSYIAYLLTSRGPHGPVLDAPNVLKISDFSPARLSALSDQ